MGRWVVPGLGINSLIKNVNLLLMTRSIVWLLLSIVLLQCSKSGDPAPVAVQRLPFDEFVMQTKLGSVSVPAGSKIYYFDAWGVLRPNTTSQDIWHYYSTDDGAGVMPTECSRTYIKTGSLITATVKGAVTRAGATKANDLDWKSTLNFTIHITANTSTKVVSGATIEFTDYGQKIDFTSQATCSFTKFNGWDEMVLGCSSVPVTTNDNFTLNLKCEFRERLN